MSVSVLRSLLVVGFVSAVLTAGSARAGGGNKQGDGDQDDQGENNTRGRAVPEFDAAAVGSIAALVAAGGLLIARRRSNR